MSEPSQILEAVDNLLQIHEDWANNPDPALKYIPPKELEDSANYLFEVSMYADVPATLRELVAAVDEFRLQWELYATGAIEQNTGGPKATLWRALNKVIATRAVSSELRVKRPEPVKVLLDQKVTPQQIALSIYGYDGKGPFVKDGEIQFELIKQEAENPGSVIPPEWIPPYEEARLRQHHIQVKRRTAQVDDMIEKTSPKPQDPVSLLREGQFIDVIAEVCNLTQAEVRGIAKVIGVEPAIRRPLVSERAPQERPLVRPTRR